MKLKNTGTFVIESLWSKDLRSPSMTVGNLFNLLKSNLDIDYTVLSTNTLEELKHSLDLACKNSKSFRVLYFGAHGIPNAIRLSLSEDTDVTLDELADFMGNRFRLWAVHFGSCSVLKSDDDTIKRFMEKTGIKMLTGYTKDVDWLESTAHELLWFYYLYDHYEDLEKFREVWYNRYDVLNKQNGFKFFLKGDL